MHAFDRQTDRPTDRQRDTFLATRPPNTHTNVCMLMSGLRLSNLNKETTYLLTYLLKTSESARQWSVMSVLSDQWIQTCVDMRVVWGIHDVCPSEWPVPRRVPGVCLRAASNTPLQGCTHHDAALAPSHSMTSTQQTLSHSRHREHSHYDGWPCLVQ